MRDQGWETPRGAGAVPDNTSRHKSMVATWSSPVLTPRDRGDQHHNASADREQLARGADPGQTLPALPRPCFSCQRPGQPTQLFFFFFLASASLLLPMLEWLVMLLRLEMLSEEFCRLMRSSGGSEVTRERPRKEILANCVCPEAGDIHPLPCTPSLLPPKHLLSSQSHLVR